MDSNSSTRLKPGQPVFIRLNKSGDDLRSGLVVGDHGAAVAVQYFSLLTNGYTTALVQRSLVTTYSGGRKPVIVRED